MPSNVWGVSVVICTHNGASRVAQALLSLCNQYVEGQLPWEVIVIDNASTDKTSEIVRSAWPSDGVVPLRVAREERLGLSFARIRGITEAKYSIISFIDDDNWVCSNWVQQVAEVMSQHPEVGACGGFSESMCEVLPPQWFEHYKGSYAVGAQGQEAGDITETKGYLWGAGLSIRASAWQQLVTNRFNFLLVDRKGINTGSGGDSELCYALRLLGWRLWYEPRLRLRHFIPAKRLEWSFLRSLYRGFGAANVGLAPYLSVLKGEVNVVLMHRAVSSKSGKGRLMSSNLGSWGYRTEHDEKGNLELISVNSILDAEAACRCIPFIVKIDIEGFEQDLFMSNTEWVERFPLLIIELHDWMFPREGRSGNFLRCIATLDRDFVYINENIFSIRNNMGGCG